MSDVTTAAGLAGFLLARIAEDEAAARAATQGRWFRAKPSGEDFEQGAEWVVATHDEWYRCEYLCQWGDQATDVNRGPQATPGQANPGHEHLRSDMVIGSHGYDADRVILSEENEAQILRWQPARVLAECDAKRRIVELHSATAGQGFAGTGYGWIEPACASCGTSDEYAVPWPCATLRALALPYAGHPDFREEWRA